MGSQPQKVRTPANLSNAFAFGHERARFESRRGKVARPCLLFWCSFLLVGASLAGGDQALQAAVDVGAPRGRTDFEALVFGHQAQVSETHLGLVALPGDVEHDLRVLPLGLVL